jgi:hypothetical protein
MQRHAEVIGLVLRCHCDPGRLIPSSNHVSMTLLKAAVIRPVFQILSGQVLNDGCWHLHPLKCHRDAIGQPQLKLGDSALCTESGPELSTTLSHDLFIVGA